MATRRDDPTDRTPTTPTRSPRPLAVPTPPPPRSPLGGGRTLDGVPGIDVTVGTSPGGELAPEPSRPRSIDVMAASSRTQVCVPGQRVQLSFTPRSGPLTIGVVSTRFDQPSGNDDGVIGKGMGLECGWTVATRSSTSPTTCNAMPADPCDVDGSTPSAPTTSTCAPCRQSCPRSGRARLGGRSWTSMPASRGHKDFQEVVDDLAGLAQDLRNDRVVRTRVQAILRDGIMRLVRRGDDFDELLVSADALAPPPDHRGAAAATDPGAPGGPVTGSDRETHEADRLADRIDHVVVLMLENRSFDHLFGAPVPARLRSQRRRRTPW